MRLNVPISPPPQPVLPFKIDIDYRYYVVRGDGWVRYFDSIYGGGDPDWYARGTAPTTVDMSKDILIPMDLVTALMLKLIQPHELELPEHLKAFVNMIKP